MASGSAPREITLSAAWHSGAIGAELLTTDGESIQVVHRGAWSHGLGPDFQDALLLFDGRELRAGGVEIHLSTRGWIDHGHHVDPAYDAVVLHVVSRHDGTVTRRLDGALVPVVTIGPPDRFAVPDFAEWDWDRVGGDICARRTMATSPQAIRQILFGLGDIRLAVRSARIEARLSAEPPAEVLWAELLDGLGFTSNREPMRALARLVPVASLEALLQATVIADRGATARGILLGTAGFLPLSQTEAHAGHLPAAQVGRLEEAWRTRGAPWHDAGMPSSHWNRARVRPANHPIARLLSAASMISQATSRGGMLPSILEILVDEDDLVSSFRALTADDVAIAIGEDRALDMLASSVIPFALALAAHTGDHALSNAAAQHWERLPAPAGNSVTRRAARQVAGRAPLGKIGARGSQGLIHLDTVLCQPRRCFECPVASAELSVKG